MKKTFIVVLLLLKMQAFAAFIPITVTGFNRDLIANGTGPATGSISVATGIDGVGYAFVAQDYFYNNFAPGYYLPSNGVLNSAVTPGLTYQLAGYSTNNTLQITGVGTSGTLTFGTPQSAGTVYVLGTTGSGSATATITVNFTDATSQVFTGVNIADWYNTTPPPAVAGIGRVNVSNGVPEGNAADPHLYQAQLDLLPANYTKLISNVVITKTSGTNTTYSYINVLGVSISTVCSGTPTGGTATSSANTICPNTSFTLTGVNSTGGGGITYQWEYSTDGGINWNTLAGATTNPYTVTNQTVATQYRLRVTCSNGGLFVNSTVVSVGENAITQCYCTPTYNNGTFTQDNIASVTLGTLSNNTSAQNNTAPYYFDYTGQQPGTLAIPVLQRGSTYNITLTFGTDPTQYSGVWIDFNHSGTFETTEFFTLGTSAGGGGTAVIPMAIPLTALAGNTRMRIRGGHDQVVLATDPCGLPSNENYGEAEDYLVNITFPLSVGLETFEAHNAGKYNHLQWKVEQERDIAAYEVERSNDGKAFISFTNVKALNKADAHSYSVDDDSYFAPVTYYRLKIDKADGSTDYSAVLSVNLSGSNSVTSMDVYPVPATDRITVSFTGPVAEGGHIRIADVNGKLLLEQAVPADQKDATINLTSLPAGIYYIKYHDAQHNFVRTITKK